MAGLAEYENQTPAERRKACSELLTKNSPSLLDSGIAFYKENMDSDDPALRKQAWDIWKELIKKALPNVTKQEIETTTTISPEFIMFLEQKKLLEQKRQEIEEAEYEIEDD